MVSINVKNIKNVQQAFEKYGDEAVKEFSEITKIKALEVVNEAQILVPRNNGTLAQSIKQTEVNRLTYNVGTNEPYAPYMEFGTGARVQVPAEFQSMANKARGKGKGSFKQGLEEIKLWCLRKGIDVKAAYPIFVAILNNGLAPRPFMYPAYLKAKRTYAKDIKQALKLLNKKFNG